MRDLEKFFDKVSQHFFEDEAMELDYSDFNDFALECGLIHEVPYDPKIHGDIDDVEKGDAIFVRVMPTNTTS